MALGSTAGQWKSLVILNGLKHGWRGRLSGRNGRSRRAGIDSARAALRRSALDPEVMAGVAALLRTVVLIANYIPARRATRIDPMEALHHE